MGIEEKGGLGLLLFEFQSDYSVVWKKINQPQDFMREYKWFSYDFKT